MELLECLLVREMLKSMNKLVIGDRVVIQSCDNPSFNKLGVIVSISDWLAVIKLDNSNQVFAPIILLMKVEEQKNAYAKNT